jgi:hypothetical protein
MSKTRTLLLCLSVIAVSLTSVPAGAASSVSERGVRPYRPDAWITLCGLSTGCTIDPPPHPWRGNDVYNRTGYRQSWSVRMQDGEGVRFWIRLQNDGTSEDTLRVLGCKGTERFVVNAVLIGKHKRPNWQAENITKAFKRGTATFPFGPAPDGGKVFLTVNIIAPTPAEGVTYHCPITIASEGNPDRTDTVVATMTTY